MPRTDHITITPQELAQVQQAININNIQDNSAITIIVDEELITVRDVDGFKLAQLKRDYNLRGVMNV